MLRLLIALAGAPLWMGTPQGRAELPCSSASTTAAMRACEDSRYTKAQQDLQAAYTQLARQLDPAARARLNAAESAWTRFRDANAAFEAGAASGGSLAPLLRVTTLAEMTEARAAELKKSLHSSKIADP